MNRDGRTKYLDWILKYEKKKKRDNSKPKEDADVQTW